MLFSAASFAPFLALFFFVTYVTRGRVRLIAFVVMSYLFYAASAPAFVVLLFASTFVDYLVGKRLYRTSAPTARSLLMLASLTLNLGLLGVFKYAGFFSTEINRLFSLLELPFSLDYVDIPLPIGISFYTFQSLSYSLDIYRRRLKPATDPWDFACFVAFFPQLIAGPIVRASHFLPQLKTYRPLLPRDTAVGMEFILLGLFKKMVVADNLAPIVGVGFDGLFKLSPADLMLASGFFAVQIYCDFSGYTDVARGIGKILGFHFPSNFRWPYFSHNLQEFWRRWHITLFSWIRDYVYIPLGGSRGSRLYVVRNVLITWFLCGLWHGAAWTFVAWGLYNGLLVTLSRYVAVPTKTAGRIVAVLVTFTLTCFGWMLFRCPSLDAALAMILKASGAAQVCAKLGLGVPLDPRLAEVGLFQGFPYCGWFPVAAVAMAAALHLASYRAQYSLDGKSLISRLPVPAYLLSAGLMLFLILTLRGPMEPFIYFAF